MAKVSVECPGCGAKLSLPDRSKLGKKIKCPKCSDAFVAEAPDDDDADAFDEDDAPAKSASNRKRGGSASGKKSSGKKSGGESGGGNGVMIGGGIAVAVVLLIAGLFFAGVFGGSKPEPIAAPAPVAASAPVPVPVSPITPAEKMLALRWLPADTELLIHVKLADIWAAPLLKSALEQPSVAAGVADFQKQTTLLPTEIESITLGVADLSGALLRTNAAGGTTPPPPGAAGPSSGPPGMPSNPFGSLRPEDQRVVVVIRTKKAIDLKTLLESAPGTQQKEKNGKTYFEAPVKPLQPASGGWAADSNTLIFGTLADMLATIDRGETVVPRKEFSGVEHASHIVLASVVKETKPEDLPAGIEIPAALAMMQSGIKDYGVQRLSLGLSIKGGFDLHIAAASSSADGSKKMKTELETQLEQLKSQFGVIKATAPPLLGDLGQLLIDNIKLDEQSQQMRVATSVPDSAQKQLEQLPAILTVMAMTGGFGSMAGGPPPSLGAGPSPASAPVASAIQSGSLEGGKKPGETEAVPSITAEGLPDGLTLSAKTSWSDFSSMSADGKQSVPVQLMFDVSGASLNTYCAIGQVSMKTMSLEGNRTLKTSKNAVTFGADPLKGLVPYNSEDKLSFEHPAGSLRVRFSVDPPAVSATKIAALEGTFQLLTFGSASDFTISDAPKKALRALADPDLKAAGVKLLLNKPLLGGAESLTLSCGKAHFLGKATASSPGTAAGVTNVFLPEIDKGQTVLRLQGFDQGGKFSEKLEVKFKLFRDVKEQTVSFRFENVPLPTADSKPKSQTP
ncbi:MAG: hypothetical protein NTZ32_06265 [Planctomycetales bacterium]|nr:hypothetical protein [Planctomycetales bacterium]